MRLRNAFKYSVFEASKSVSTKTLLLKHYYRRQGMLEVWGGQRKAKNRAKNAAKNDFFRRIFSPKFSANFFRVFFVRSENGKRRRKKVSQNFNIKIQHGMMIQSRMPTRWSCKPIQCNVPMGAANKISKNGFFLLLVALHPSSHQEKGTWKMVLQSGGGGEKWCMGVASNKGSG